MLVLLFIFGWVPDQIKSNQIKFYLVTHNTYYVHFITSVVTEEEGRKEGTYLFDQTTIVNTIHIYENAMVRRLSLRLNIAASATATEIIIIII